MALSVGTWSAPARGDTAPTDPNDPRTPLTVAADALPTAQIDGVAWKQAIVAGKVYAAGSFSTARPAGAAPGTSTSVRNNLLAYSLSSGVLDTAFHPSLNAQALDVVGSPDGRRLYVGGDFTSVSGTTVYRVAAFDLSTGALITSFRPRFNGQVRGIALNRDGSVLYAGGLFSSVNGVARARLAAVSTSDGSLRPWAPTADKRVNSLVVSPDGSKVVVAGQFTMLDGSSKPGFGLGAVTADTGALVKPFQVNDVVRNAGDQAGFDEVSSDGTYFYGTAWKFGGTGNFEGSFQARWSDLTINWLEDCHGDTYDVWPGPTAVYTVGHAHTCSTIGGFPETNPRTWHRSIAFSRARTGTVGRNLISGYYNFEGQPAPSLLHWFPDLDTGVYTGQSQGPWTVTGNQGYVVLGGEFRHVNNKSQQGLVRFAVSTIAPNKQGPRLSGTAITPTASVSGSSVTVRWPSNYDRDNRNLTYSVLRDASTTPVNTRLLASTFWQPTTLSYTDLDVPAGTHSYRVRITDPFGNTVTSSPVSVTVAGAAAAQPQGLTASTPSTGSTTDPAQGLSSDSSLPGGPPTPTQAPAPRGPQN